MNRVQYAVYGEKVDQFEPIIRQFLFEKSDVVKMTQRPSAWSCLVIILLPIPIMPKNMLKDPRFQETLKRFQPDLVEEKVNNMLCNDLEQFKDSRFHHYYYRCPNNIKKYFDECSLLDPPYGFEDPTFYVKGDIIASAITHESMIMLFLTDSERKQLVERGLIFEDIHCCGVC